MKNYKNRLSSVNHLIQIYHPTQVIQKLLNDKLPLFTDDSRRIVRLFLDVRGSFVNIHDLSGKTLLANLSEKQNHNYSRKTIALVNSWFSYLMTRGYQVEFVIFAEHGTSRYHERISNGTYKEKRIKTNKEETPEEIKKVADAYVNSELTLLQYIFSTVGTKAICYFVEETEVDFVPQMVISNDEKPDNYFNIILSKDKDLTQILQYPNTIQIKKSPKLDYEIVEATTAGIKMLKLKFNIPIEYFSLALALIGDLADSVYGVDGIGVVKAQNIILELLDELDEIDGDAHCDNLLEIIDKKDLTGKKNCIILKNKLDVKVLKHDNRTNRELLTDSYKMVDFAVMLADEEINQNVTQPLINQYNQSIVNYNYNHNDQEYIDGKKKFLTNLLLHKFKFTSNELFNAWLLQIR